MKKRILALFMTCIIVLSSFSIGISGILAFAEEASEPVVTTVTLNAYTYKDNASFTATIDSYAANFDNITSLTINYMTTVTNIDAIINKLPNLETLTVYSATSLSFDAVTDHHALKTVKFERVQNSYNLDRLLNSTPNLTRLLLNLSKLSTCAAVNNLNAMQTVSFYSSSLLFDADILLNSMPNLTSLQLSNGSNLPNYTKIQNLNHLETLYIDSYEKNEPIADFFLNHFTTVNTLNLSTYACFSIKIDKELPSLKKIMIQNSTNLKNADSLLNAAVNLESLTISYTDLENINFTVAHNNLTKLDITGCDITNMDSLFNQSPNLKTVDLSSLEQLTTSGISTVFQQLETIDFRIVNNAQFNEALVSNAPNLVKLDFDRTAFDFNHFPILSKLKTLTVRTLDKSGFQKIMSNSESLEDLTIYEGTFDNLVDVSNLNQLKYLTLSSCELTSAAGMENCQNLKVANLVYCPKLADISQLNAPSLQGLELDSCESFSSLSNINNYPTLTNLCLFNLGLRDLTGLKTYPNLEVLRISSFDKLTDISALPFFSTLKQLTITDCNSLEKVDRLAVYSASTALENVNISDNAINSLEGIRQLAVIPSLTNLNIQQNYLKSFASELLKLSKNEFKNIITFKYANYQSHVWYHYTQIKAPTCTEEGLEMARCSDCGEYRIQAIPKLAHNFSNYKVIKKATCQENGLIRRTCQTCGYVEEVETTAEHTYDDNNWVVEKAPTHTQVGIESNTCTICGKVTKRIIPVSHDGEWTIVNEPTCQSVGLKKKVCTTCGETEYRKIPQLSHTGEWKAVPINEKDLIIGYSTTYGYPVSKEVQTCTRCGEVSTRYHYSNEDDSNCVWIITKQATDTIDGKAEKVNLNLGDTITTMTLPATQAEHDWGEWVRAVDYTCYTICSDMRVCSKTNEIEDITRSSSPSHSYWNVIDVAPTCQTEGLAHKCCTFCGETLPDSTYTLPKTEHTVDTSKPIVLPTQTEDGYAECTCSVCGETFTKVIPKLELPSNYTLNGNVITVNYKRNLLEKSSPIVSFGLPFLDVFHDENIIFFDTTHPAVSLSNPGDYDACYNIDTSLLQKDELLPVKYEGCDFYIKINLIDCNLDADSIKTTYVDQIQVDNDAKKITLYSSLDETEVLLHDTNTGKTGSSGIVHYFTVFDKSISYSGHNFRIYRPSDSNIYKTTVMVDEVEYELEVIFQKTTFEPSLADLKTLYTDDVILDNENKTITINAKEGLDKVVIYNEGSISGVTVTLPENENISLYTAYRYMLTKPAGSQTLHSTVTIAYKNRKDLTTTYDLTVNFVPKEITLSQSEIQTLYTKNVIVDNTAGTITLNSNAGLSYVVLYNVGVTNGMTFTLTEDDYVSHYSTYRYKITKPTSSDQYKSKVIVTTKDGSRVYDLIVNFSPNITLPQTELRLLYADGAVVDNNAGIITLTSTPGRDFLALYNIGVTSGITFTIAEDSYVEHYSTYRYKITKPANGNQYKSKITVTTNDGSRNYTLVVNFVPNEIVLSQSEIQPLYTDNAAVDNDAGTITLNSKAGLNYVALYNVGITKGVTFTLTEDDYVNHYSTYRYKITKPANSNQYTSKITVATKNGTRDYNLIVNFIPREVTVPQSEIQSLYTDSAIIDNTNHTMTLTSKSGSSYVALYNVGITKGVTFTLTEDDYVNHYSTYRYKISKPQGDNQYTSKVTIQTKEGSAIYDLIVNFI